MATRSAPSRHAALPTLGGPPQAADVLQTIARTASQACGSTIAVLCLGERHSARVAAAFGLPQDGQACGLAASCLQLARPAGVVQKADALQDPGCADHPMVPALPAVRFFAGVALLRSDGSHLGALCVLDTCPRQLDGGQAALLQSLAGIASQALELQASHADGDGTPARPQADADRPPAWGDDAVDDNFAYAWLRDMRHGAGERQSVSDALRTSRQQLARAGDVAAVGAWELDLRTAHVTWSEQTRRIHEVDDAFMPTLEGAIAFYAPVSQPVIREAVETALRTGRSWDLELRLVTHRGRQIWVRAVGEVVFEDRRPVRMLGAFQDVTQRKNLERLTARLTSTLHAVIESVPAQVSVVDRDGIVQFANGGFERWLGLARERIVGQPLRQLMGPTDREGGQAWTERVAAGETVTVETEHAAGRDRGRWAITCTPLWNEHGQTDGFVQVVRSIKQHRIDEAGLQQACHRDALTGLLDPVGFVRYLERQSAAAPHARLAVLSIDLALPDRSHVALDAAAQDRLLQLFAWRLGMLVRPADAVARLAERQFAVVLTDIAEPRFATAVADKVHAVASHPFALESGLAQVGVRVGMAWTAEPGESWGALLARADAMAAGAGAQDAGPAPANGWPASA